MRANELRLNDVTDIESIGGLMRWGSRRVFLCDAEFLGVIRRQLVVGLGQPGASALLTRLGYAQGYRMAEALRQALRWENEREWQAAGPRLLQLGGLCVLEPESKWPELPAKAVEQVLWRDGSEAEQHAQYFGRNKNPVCWTTCGFLSGYLSAAHGKEIYALESACVAAGDRSCTAVACAAKDWGPELKRHLPAFRQNGDLIKEMGQALGSGEKQGSVDAVRPLADVERDYILSVLSANNGHRTHTAKQLKIGTATLFRKLKQYGITD